MLLARAVLGELAYYKIIINSFIPTSYHPLILDTSFFDNTQASSSSNLTFTVYYTRTNTHIHMYVYMYCKNSIDFSSSMS